MCVCWKDDSEKSRSLLVCAVSAAISKDVYSGDKGYNFCYPKVRQPAWQSLKLLLMRFPYDTSRAGGMEMEWLSACLWARYFHVCADFSWNATGDTACYPLYGPRPCRICQCRKIKTMLHEDKRFRHIRVKGVNPRMGKDYNEKLLLVQEQTSPAPTPLKGAFQLGRIST